MGRYINDAPRHENECNANIEKIIVDYKPALVLFARRFINAGEEIKYDYGVKNLPWRCKEVNKCVLFDIFLGTFLPKFSTKKCSVYESPCRFYFVNIGTNDAL